MSGFSQSSAIEMQINGRAVAACESESVLAALQRAGCDFTRRDQQGAPRAAVCGMGVCQECAVSIDGEPGQLACLRRCRNNMQVVTDV